jgi:diguanylate cyclase (GGDEF)-like protein/excisionase family DNA binding protein
VAQAAARLGVHPNTVRTWAEAGRLAAYRINSRGDRRFRAGDVERLLVEGALSDGSTLVIRNDDGARDGRLAVLARLARSPSASSSVNAAARTAVEALRSDAGYARAAIYLTAGDGLALETHAGYRVAPEARLDGDLAAVGSGSVSSDRHGPRAEVPLRTTREAVGLLVVEDDMGGGLDDSHLGFLRTVAAAVTSAMQHARTLARARREVQRARVLRQVTQELTGQLDPNIVLADIVERTRSLFDADKAGLWLLGDETRPFHLAAARGLGDAFLERVASLTLDADTLGVRAIRDRRPYWMRGADIDGRVGALRDAYAAEGITTVCLVPLVGADQALGILGLFHAHDRDWPDGEVALVQAFANQAAVAIQNARLYRSVADQAARMRSIQDLSARLNRLTDVQAIADAIVAEAKTLADYNDIRVYRVDWERRTCEPIAYTKGLLGHGVEDVVERLRVRVGAGSLTGWVAEHGEPLLINDALHDTRSKTIEGTDDVEESMLVVPMLYEGRALGVIVLSQLGTGRFTPDDLQTMSIFAGYAAQAIANASAYERLADQSDELARQLDSQRRLLEINERLLSTLDQAAVLELIADGLGSVVAYDNLSIFRADPLRRHLTAVLAREAYEEEVMRHVVPFGRGLMGWVVEHGEPVLANDALADPRALQIPGTPTEPEAIIVVPLVADGEVIGAMNVGRIGGEEVYFSAADFELVKLFAGQASIALRNADAHQAVNLRAETDALTGLANHGAFQRDLGRLLEATAGRSGAGRRLSLLMMDLDSFKAYNDRLGHPAGDALLHAVGTAIYGAARSEDRVYRYGGDEFALILPGATVAEATRAARRIAATVRRLTEDDPTPVTITIGVASAPRDATDRDGLLAAADAALYLGKQSGEDRVVRADEVPRDTLNLRGTLAALARTALRGRAEQEAVGHLVEEAARLSGTHEGRGDSVRDALLAVARSFEARDTAARGHGDRVGRLAVRIGEHLGLDADRVRTIELAARLHALEDAGVTELDPIPSLSDVGALIRGYRALLDAGARRTTRAARARGPLGVHIVAVADGYDEHLAGLRGPRLGRRLALQHLRADPATFRREVIDALGTVVAQRSDAGRRRRRVDAPDEERGAA